MNRNQNLLMKIKKNKRKNFTNINNNLLLQIYKLNNL